MITKAVAKFNNQKALFSPLVDFICIGGLGVFFFFVTELFLPVEEKFVANVVIVAFYLQLLVNFPHFAASYQLLYENIRYKLTDQSSPITYRMKMFNAAYIVPIVLVILLAYTFFATDHAAMGYMVNAMFFFVGWHYVKQGYGMLMVISALNKIYFKNTEKLVILMHSYSMWLVSWWLYNENLKDYGDLWGIPYKSVDFKSLGWAYDILTTVVLFIAIITSCIIIVNLIKRIYNKEKWPPFNAIIGYAAALYLWIVALELHPINVAFIPAFHSLQYLLFVLKYKKTEYIDNAEPEAVEEAKYEYKVFISIALVLGTAGFFIIPTIMDITLIKEGSELSPTYFVFAWHIFINIHHYFIDNVIWRKENKNVAKFLMPQPKK